METKPLTDQQRNTLTLWAEKTTMGTFYDVGEVFKDRQAQQTMRTLAGLGVVATNGKGRLAGGNPYAPGQPVPERGPRPSSPGPLFPAEEAPAAAASDGAAAQSAAAHPRPAPPPSPPPAHADPLPPGEAPGDGEDLSGGEDLPGELVPAGPGSLGEIMQRLAQPTPKTAVRWRVIDKGKGIEAAYLPAGYYRRRLTESGPWSWAILERWAEDAGGGKRVAMVLGRLTLHGTDGQAELDGMGGAPLGERPADDIWQSAASNALKTAAGNVIGLDVRGLPTRKSNGQGR